MSDFQLDPRRIRANFSHAAAGYEQHDALQREVQQLLLERLDFYLQQPERVIDVGAGTGRGSALLKKRYGKAQVIAVDAALPMLRTAKSHASWLKPFARVCGEATALPLPDHSVDVLHSNLCFQWIDDLPALFGECVRVLKPGGMLLYSTFGPDTLRELRAAWAAVDQHSHVSRFLDMHDLGDAMINAGLARRPRPRTRPHRQTPLSEHAGRVRGHAREWPHSRHLGSGDGACLGPAAGSIAPCERRWRNRQFFDRCPARVAAALITAAAPAQWPTALAVAHPAAASASRSCSRCRCR
jgi:malonyl-ACP O-methyltransferase BioC